MVANADPKELVPVLRQAQPNKIRLEAKDEDKYIDKLLVKAKIITESANKLWRKSFQPYVVQRSTDPEPQSAKCRQSWRTSKSRPRVEIDTIIISRAQDEHRKAKPTACRTISFKLSQARTEFGPLWTED